MSDEYKPICKEFRTRYCYDYCNWFGVCLEFDREDEFYAEAEKGETQSD